MPIEKKNEERETTPLRRSIRLAKLHNLPKLMEDKTYQTKRPPQKSAIQPDIPITPDQVHHLSNIISELQISQNILEHNFFTQIYTDIANYCPSVSRSTISKFIEFVLIRQLMLNRSCLWVDKYKPLKTDQYLNAKAYTTIQKELFGLSSVKLKERDALFIVSSYLKGKNSALSIFCHQNGYFTENIDFAHYKDIRDICSVYKYASKFKDIKISFDQPNLNPFKYKEEYPCHIKKKKSKAENRCKKKEKKAVVKVKPKGGITSFFQPVAVEKEKKRKNSDSIEIISVHSESDQINMLEEENSVLTQKITFSVNNQQAKENNGVNKKRKGIDPTDKRKKLFIFRNLDYLRKNLFKEDRSKFNSRIEFLIRFITNCEYPSVFVGDKQDEVLFSTVEDDLIMIELEDYILPDSYKERLIALSYVIITLESAFESMPNNRRLYKSLNCVVDKEEFMTSFSSGCFELERALREGCLGRPKATLQYVKEIVNLFHSNSTVVLNKLDFFFKTSAQGSTRYSVFPDKILEPKALCYTEYIQSRYSHLESYIKSRTRFIIDDDQQFIIDEDDIRKIFRKRKMQRLNVKPANTRLRKLRGGIVEKKIDNDEENRDKLEKQFTKIKAENPIFNSGFTDRVRIELDGACNISQEPLYVDLPETNQNLDLTDLFYEQTIQHDITSIPSNKDKSLPSFLYKPNNNDNLVFSFSKANFLITPPTQTISMHDEDIYFAYYRYCG